MIEIHVGDVVTVEWTTGQLTDTPITKVITGTAYRDEEGTLRVEDVNLERDADGYFRHGVLLVSVR